MSIIVYTPDFSGFHEIANAEAVQMSYYYNDIGKLVLDVPINAHNVAALQNGRILYDTVKKLAYVIRNVKTDTKQKRITANGYTTNQMLNGRVIAASVAVSNIESGVYSIVNDNLRGMTKVATAAPKGLEESVEEFTLHGGEILDEIMPVLSEVGLGNRMTWNHRTKEHTFEVYKGADLTTGLHAVVFSDEQGTARDLVINDDASAFKNVAYVEIVEVVGTATGDHRHEVWLDINLSQEDGETKTKFRKRMRTQGAMELCELIRQLSFTVTIDPAELGVMYNIGDIVACVSKRFGVRFNARISGVKYKKDSKSEAAEIILGEPLLITIGEVELSG